MFVVPSILVVSTLLLALGASRGLAWQRARVANRRMVGVFDNLLSELDALRPLPGGPFPKD